jgi:hypothetical protein
MRSNPSVAPFGAESIYAAIRGLEAALRRLRLLR